MKNIYYFLAGLLVAFVLLRGWQPPVGRYQMSAGPNGVYKMDTAMGRVWGVGAGTPEWKEIGTNP